MLATAMASPLWAAPAARAEVTTATPANATVPAAPMQEDGLETKTSVSYTVDPAAAVVKVKVEATVTNQIPNRTSGGVIEQAYFSEIGVPVLTEAANFQASTSGGAVVAVTPKDVGNQFVRSALVDLQPNLFYGQSQTVTLTYDLPNQKPRAPGVSRANDAFVTFPVFVFGDSGQASVEVRLPDRYEVEVVGGPLEEATKEGQTVLTAANIEDPDGFSAFIVGTDDAKLVDKAVDADGAEVEVRAWPDDAAWADFAAKQVAEAKPVLEDLIGQPWPRDDALEIVETASPYAYGYAGWYSEADHKISVGDELDPRVMVHELSHVWFNSSMFADRWVAEGFAEEYSTTVLDELGQRQGGPAAPDRRGDGAIALNDWSDPSLLDENSDATERYGYAASWYVVDQLAQEVGVDQLREVIAAVADQEISYTGDPDPESYEPAANWQRLLDLLEDRAGSEAVGELWDGFVVNDEQRALLAQRTEARTAYDGLVERGGEWTPPLELRQLMTQWKFDAVADAVEDADAILEVRDDIDEALEGLDVSPQGLEEAYESARATDDLQSGAESTLEAAKAYRAADEHLDEGSGPLGAIGLLGSGTDDRLDTARDELESGDAAASLRASAAVERRLDNAVRDGALRLAAVILVLGAVLFVVLRTRRWRRRRGQKRIDRAADELAPIGPLSDLTSRPEIEPRNRPARSISPPHSGDEK